MTDPTEEGEEPRTGLLAELKRRRVFRAAVGYAAGAFVTLEAADLVLPALGAPGWSYRFLVIAAIVGLPVVCILAWLFEVSSEGIRLEGRRGGKRGALVAGSRTILVYGGVGIAGVVVTVAIFLWPGMGTASGEVAAGADVIAVLPFHATGGSAAYLGEGMVDLLSRNLNEVGAIRTVDSRTVLYRWARRARGGTLPLDSALALGREVEAGSILTGSITEAGPSVRITADLYGVDGTRLAEARVDGPSERVLALVDSLSVELLKRIWRSTEQRPSVSTSAITSGDLDAIRAFLEGERYFRMSWWEAALASYREAVQADSTFALAHFRLSYVAGWSSSIEGGAEVERKAVESAARHSDRLPERERTLVRAQVARQEGGWNAALPILREAVRRYPDDPEMHHFYGDVRFHVVEERPAPGRPSLDEVLAPFERAMELDPSFTPAFIHPFELAFRAEDAARVGRYLSTLRDLSEGNRLARKIYEAGLSVLRSPGDRGALLTALALAMEGREEESGTLAWQASRAVVPALHRVALRLPAARRRAAAAWLESRSTKRGREPTPAELESLITLTAGGGEVARAREILGRPSTAEVLPDGPSHVHLTLGYVGYAPPVRVPGDGALSADERRRAVAAVQAFDVGDARRIRAALAGLDASGGESGRPTAGRIRRIREAGAGLARVVEGDTVEGLRAVERALERLPFGPGTVTEALWFRWVALAARRPETRDRALPVLRRPWAGSPLYEPLRLYHLARALEAAGDGASVDVYRRFVAAMGSADPELPVADLVADARERAGGREREPGTSADAGGPRRPPG